MSTYIPPRHIELDLKPYIEEFTSDLLVKDLLENERICPMCHGMGVIKIDKRFNTGDNPVFGFPYNHQSLFLCPQCYDGVVKVCKYCGKPIQKGYTKCNCNGQREQDIQDEIRKDAEKMAAAKKYEPDALGTEFHMGYSDSICSGDGYFLDWEEFFEAWAMEHAETDPRPEYVWGTDEIKQEFDANSIVESSCEDLYDDAICDIRSDAIAEMQTYFNEWLKKYGLYSYMPSQKHAVRIPWDQYKK